MNYIQADMIRTMDMAQLRTRRDSLRMELARATRRYGRDSRAVATVQRYVDAVDSAILALRNGR